MPSTGRFLTRDTWRGDYNRPLSLNKWMYVEGNPTNLTDPSGMCAQGKCGPDLTEWFLGQMQDHYQYGLRIRAEVERMKLRALLPFTFNCSGISLLGLPPSIATETPFREIVSQTYIPYTSIPMEIGINLLMVDQNNRVPVINALALLEYALYGLAVDYSNIDYPVVSQCSTPGCETFGGHEIITICDKCVDSSDLGNLMFGLGGAARGYSLLLTYPSAASFNVFQNRDLRTMLGPDGRGAIFGWQVATLQAFRTQNGFCSLFDSLSPIGWNENGTEINSQCTACNVSLPWVADVKSADDSKSLITISSHDRSTIEWLGTFIPGL